LIATNASAGER
jgi:hypothetical protein